MKRAHLQPDIRQLLNKILGLLRRDSSLIASKEVQPVRPFAELSSI